MCIHVLCLPLKGPPLLSFELIYGVSPHSLSLSYWFCKSLQQFVSLISCFILSLEHYKPRMRNPDLLKQEFFKKWMIGLRACSSLNKSMSFFERKKAMKLSANLAMASANKGRTRWSRATIAKALSDENNKIMAKKILGHRCFSVIQSKKILKRSKIIGIKRRSSSSIHKKLASKRMAKSMIKNRTQSLKKLLPGGELMDGISLIEETLDYISSLSAQVDVMRCFVKASECMTSK